MKALLSFEMSGTAGPTTRRHIPEHVTPSSAHFHTSRNKIKGKNYEIFYSSQLAHSAVLNLSIPNHNTLIQSDTTHVYVNSTGYTKSLQINLAPPRPSFLPWPIIFKIEFKKGIL
jgi:hypothetical protein